MKKWYSMKALATPGEAEIDILDEIGGWGISAKQFKSDLDALGKLEKISLNISSPGGDTVEGAAIYNFLEASGAKITARIVGMAASMASIIAMAADKIIMPENTLLMIHNPWMMTWGDAEKIRKDADLLDKVKTQLMSAYMKRTAKTEAEISALLDAETWLTAKEAAEIFNNVEVVESLAVAACVVARPFKNLPESAKAWLKNEAENESSATPDTENTPPAEPAQDNGESAAAESTSDTESGPSVEPPPLGYAAAESRNSELKKFEAIIEKKNAELKARDEKISRLNDALNKKQSELDKTLTAFNDLSARHARLVSGGLSFEPEIEDWSAALAKCGGDYTKARKSYPGAFSTYIKNHPARKN